jgi:hypothetical protein
MLQGGDVLCREFFRRGKPPETPQVLDMVNSRYTEREKPRGDEAFKEINQ